MHEARTRTRCFRSGLFRRRNFAFGNLETFAMYGGLSAVIFFLVLFLQQVAGYDALQAGLATLPITLVMFLLSRRAGRLADRYGPRWFMGGGPLVAAAGLCCCSASTPTSTTGPSCCPALVLFALGLSATVAPLTATVLADADEHNAGIASGVNNAIARVAGLLAVAAIGAVVAAQFNAHFDERLGGRPLSPAGRTAPRGQGSARSGVPSRTACRRARRGGWTRRPRPRRSAPSTGVGIAAALVALGGVLGLVGIRNPRRDVPCEGCPGGQLAGAPLDAARPRRRPGLNGTPTQRAPRANRRLACG